MPKTYKLWSGKKITPESIPLLERVTHIMTHRAKKGHYQFLLGADIVEHKGILYCGWGNSRVYENDSGSIMGGRRSNDLGITWGDFERIAPGSKGKDAHSHGVFFSHYDKLYVLAPRAEYNKFGATYPNLRTELFILDENNDQWRSEGIIISGEQFWPLNQPLKMDNGNYIIPGITCNNEKAEPAVAISTGNDIRNWHIVNVPTPKRKDTWGEGGLIIDGSKITFIYRNGWKHGQLAQVATSEDFGETWSRPVNSNLPMSPAKPCCGTLSTGQKYIVFNPAGNNRNTLAIAVAASGSEQFSKVYRLQHGASPEPRMKGLAISPQWAYPCAYEYDRNLYVAYASTKEDCILSIIPINTLT